MREILFRGFCPNENGKQMITLDGEDIRGDWVYGDLIHNIDCIKIRERETDINRIAKSYIVEKETVGQYTGVMDKNGKQVWEGDIVRFGDSTKMNKKGEIKYSSGAFLPIENGIGYTSWAIACEIIGDKFNTKSVE